MFLSTWEYIMMGSFTTLSVLRMKMTSSCSYYSLLDIKSILESPERVSLAKECCRALYHLTSDNEANRQRVNSSTTNNANVIDTLTAILASNDEAVFNEEVKVWAKKTMEALFTSSQA